MQTTLTDSLKRKNQLKRMINSQMIGICWFSRQKHKTHIIIVADIFKHFIGQKDHGVHSAFSLTAVGATGKVSSLSNVL